MKTYLAALGVALAMVPLVSIAAPPKASPAAEKQLWAFAERVALALPGNVGDVQRLLPGAEHSATARAGTDSRAAPTELAPSLFVTNAAVVMGDDRRATSASFDVTGSCVSMASMRTRYPSVIVMDYARGDNEHATYTFGAQVGDAIIAYSFPAKHLDCMSRVEVTPAKETKSRLGIQ
ncbi:hypothetical protein LL974_00675 [Xanthomonas campestris pv. cannae]|nr:hypothetical protein [Xanthomonas campestris pv. cannae]